MVKKEIYDKINSTLNEVFTNVFIYDEKIVLGYDKYLLSILKLSDYSVGILDEDFDFYNFSTQINRDKYVSINETIDICRKILSSIDSAYDTKYLDSFNNMIYDCVDIELDDPTLIEPSITWNHFEYICDYIGDEELNVRDKKIDIHLYGNYDDVRNLIHEFFHYYNFNDGNNLSRAMLTEAISIYFETYAVKYMIENNICSPKELDTTFRIRDFLDNADAFNKVGLYLFYFTTLGNLSDESYDFLYSNFVGFDREVYESGIHMLYEYINTIEDNYEEDIMSHDIDLNEYMTNTIRNDFKRLNYLIGTLFTSHMLDKGNIIQVNYVNEAIKNGIPVEDIFSDIGIDITELKEECEEMYVDVAKNDRYHSYIESILNSLGIDISKFKEEYEEKYGDGTKNDRYHPYIESILNSFGKMSEELIGYSNYETKKATR